MIKKRKKISVKSDTKELAEEIVEETKKPRESKNKEEADYSKMVSTGSTLLDLTICGNKGVGGIPGGIIVEIFGPPGSGKTSILSEISASAQSQGGQVRFLDPEARLDKEYARIYGMQLDKKDYYRPDTVTEMMSLIKDWEPKNKEALNVIATDSLAALSTIMEMESEDKRGQRRAKEFSEGLRKITRIIRKNGWVVACSNQLREGDYGKITPGGQAIPFYSSLRIAVDQVDKIEREIDNKGKKIKKIIGVESKCFIKKSTVDDPYRECRIFIIFNYGIDNVRGNLQYLKDMNRSTSYECPDGKTYQSMEKAIFYVEEKGLQKQLEDKVIELWHEIENKFKTNRKVKER